MRPRTLAAIVAVAVTASARIAAADDPVVAFDAVAIGGVSRLHGVALHIAPGDDEPTPLVNKELTLEGSGRSFGGGAKIAVFDPDGLRVDFGITALGLSGLRSPSKPLAPGLTISPGTPTALDFSLSMGKAFGEGPVVPYVEIGTGLEIVSARIVLNLDSLGTMGSASYNAWKPILDTRVGAFVPLDRTFFLDFSAAYGVGAAIWGGGAGATMTAGLGVWNGHLEENESAGHAVIGRR